MDASRESRGTPPAVVGWGLIGTTNWSVSTFAPAILSSSRQLVQLRAVLGSSQENLDSFFSHFTGENENNKDKSSYKEQVKGVKGFVSIEEFLQSEDFQVVWIASGTRFHHEQTLRCLRAGKHVLVEKPMTLEPSLAQEMVSEAHKHQRLLSIGFHNRHNPALQQLRSLMLSDTFGDLLLLRFHFYIDVAEAPQLRSKLETEHKHGGGFAIDWIGAHLLDMATWFVGELELESAALTNAKWGLSVDDHALLVLKASQSQKDSGRREALTRSARILVDCSTGCKSPLPPKVELFGTRGWATLDNFFFGGGVLRYSSSSWSSELPKEEEFPVCNLYVLQVENFSRCVQTNSPPAVSADEATLNVRLTHRAKQSFRPHSLA